MSTTRREKDPLGTLDVPSDAMYGVQTLRAKQNFMISGLAPMEAFVTAQVWIKKAAALTHKQTGRLEGKLADAIVAAADEVLAGKHRDQFIVDPYQAGAGTSHNMNANEVLANRANEILGGKRGEYSPVHPNDHVNMAQSTNDTIPTNIRLVCLSARSLAVGVRESTRSAGGEGRGVRRHRQSRAHAFAGRNADSSRTGIHGLRRIACPRRQTGH
jgi:aspartate ammonia-lyase